MTALKTFRRGGVHPAENKFTAGAAIQTLPPPAQVSIPLGQHLGKPAEAVVQRGDEVKAGQLIGTSSGFISANVHSSVSGKVKKIDLVVDAAGVPRPAIIIDVAGDEWAEGIDTSSDLVTEITMDAAAITARIGEAGVVGAGGATFPTHVKFSVPPGRSVDTLIINGVECEPYLPADHRLMLERADEMLVGVRILMRALGVTQAFIGIENNKPDAIEHLQARIAARMAWGGGEPAAHERIEVVPLYVKYPQGGEKQLIQAILGREVPSGKLPLDVGCVVSTVGTTIAVYEAVQKNKPFVERVVTVTGKSLGAGANFRVRVGTPVSTLVDAVGGMPETTGKIIFGGPMTGKALGSLKVPITKGSGGLIFIDSAEATRPAVCNCIRCSSCVTVCPMGLEPYLLEKLVIAERWEDAEREAIMDCIECGSCSFTCPAGRPLLDWIRLGKAKVAGLRRSRS